MLLTWFLIIYQFLICRSNHSSTKGRPVRSPHQGRDNQGFKNNTYAQYSKPSAPPPSNTPSSLPSFITAKPPPSPRVSSKPPPSPRLSSTSSDKQNSDSPHYHVLNPSDPSYQGLKPGNPPNQGSSPSNHRYTSEPRHQLQPQLQPNGVAKTKATSANNAKKHNTAPRGNPANHHQHKDPRNETQKVHENKQGRGNSKPNEQNKRADVKHRKTAPSKPTQPQVANPVAPGQNRKTTPAPRFHHGKKVPPKIPSTPISEIYSGPDPSYGESYMQPMSTTSSQDFSNHVYEEIEDDGDTGVDANGYMEVIP